MTILASMHTHALMGSVCDVALSRIVSRLVPVLANNSRPAPAVLSQPRRRPMPSAKERPRMPRFLLKDPRTRTKGKSKDKDRKTKPTAKSGDVDLDENAQADPDEPEEQDADQEEDPEPYLVEAQTSEESEMDSDGMLDWSASECKITKTASWRPLRVHVQTLQSSRTLLSSKSTSSDA